MPDVLFPLDSSKKFEDQEKIGHNRWHPEIPPVATVKPGDEFRVDCREWFDGAIVNDDSAEDILNAPLLTVHKLSGPFRIEGAKPGDLLIVDILDVGPIPQEKGPLAGQGWGYTGIFAKKNGGGFLTDQFPDAYKAIWDFSGQTATSRHVPEVSFTGLIHPGLMGTAPSAELLAKWNAREGKLIATDPGRVPPLALPPEPQFAVLGALPESEFDRVAGEAARTAPPRENGGNQDIKNLSKGTRIFYPVFVDGANLSMGDLHFSQGDGEITFCGAIEMAGWVHLKVELIKDGMAKYGIKNPIFKPSPITPKYDDHLIFEGISVDESGGQHYLDVHIAYRQACLNAIEYLKKFGYSGAQAYSILGTAPVQGHISGVVDIPNACATLWIPTKIFEFDINPGADGPTQFLDGSIQMPLSPDL